MKAGEDGRMATDQVRTYVPISGFGEAVVVVVVVVVVGSGGVDVIVGGGVRSVVVDGVVDFLFCVDYRRPPSSSGPPSFLLRSVSLVRAPPSAYYSSTSYS